MSNLNRRTLAQRLLQGAAGFAALVGGFGFAAEPASAWNEIVLHGFGASSMDGTFPQAGLVADAKGNLYGTTTYGGLNCSSIGGCGTVFELSPPAAQGGTWMESVLYNFHSSGVDAAYPSAGLIRDVKGNLYGTTTGGGANLLGAVFELSPPASAGGAWSETVLYSFGPSNSDGSGPRAGLIMDARGNLYGTTYNGGANCGNNNGCGTAFELSPPATTGAAWAKTLLHSFGANSTDGTLPAASMLMDGNGNLYGTTYSGGDGRGVVFKLTPPAAAGGNWSETVLHRFQPNSPQGARPYAGLIIDANGILYGTTGTGGDNHVGNVFELTPPTTQSGYWKEKVLYSFGASKMDGKNSLASLILDAKGNLYGTTSEGGAYQDGAAFKLSPPAKAGGNWTETILYSFGLDNLDGQFPFAGLIMDAKGNLYGATSQGGAGSACTANCGTVFELTP